MAEFRRLLPLSPSTSCYHLFCHQHWVLFALWSQQLCVAATLPPHQPKRIIHNLCFLVSPAPNTKSITGSSAWPNLGCVPMSWEGKHLACSACVVGEGPAFHQDPKVEGSPSEGKGLRGLTVKNKDKCSFSNREDE